MGKLESEALPETSGLAASITDSGLFFAINDSGNLPGIYGLTETGQAAGFWPIDFSGAHDFEDLASFKLEKKSYLLVADTGDNLHWRKTLNILVFEAPEIANVGSSLKLAWQFEFNFPFGYRDVESVAVDVYSESIFLISKRHVPPELFKLPLRPTKGAIVAEFVVALKGIPQPTTRDLKEDPKYGLAKSMPTSFDINDRDAVVVTYKEAYLYRRNFGENWREGFSEMPHRVPLPTIYGLESVAFDPTARHFFVTGERKNGISSADVFRITYR